MDEFDALIIFADGTTVIMPNVTQYGYIDSGVFFYDKCGFRNYIPKEYVRFMGVKFKDQED